MIRVATSLQLNFISNFEIEFEVIIKIAKFKEVKSTKKNDLIDVHLDLVNMFLF